jgi:uncharacterized protein YdhG (YjbR/CyaY superfamily)
VRTSHKALKNIDKYVKGFPEDVQQILQEIRTTIRKAAPNAEETISYRMPTFTLKGLLVSFAAYKKHIGLYPAPRGSEKFNRELSRYRAARSTVRFPLDKPVPFQLIRQIVKLRAKENLRRAREKGKKK